MKVQILFKWIFFGGCGICFLSLFMELYSLQVFDQAGNLLAAWNYTILRGWRGINSSFRPPDLLLSFEFMITYLGTIVIATIISLIKNVETADNLNKFGIYSYTNIFLVLMVGFMIVVFPIFFLLQNGLYFPMLIVYDEAVDAVFSYSVGISYYLQLIGFVLIFPFVVFYYQTIRKFKITSYDVETQTYKRLEEENEAIDLDRFIAEERLKDEYHQIKRKKDREFEFKTRILREGGF